MATATYQFLGYITVEGDIEKIQSLSNQELIEHLLKVVVTDLDTETHGNLSEDMMVQGMDLEWSTLKRIEVSDED
tara:strand:+ start:480 stop:704 length:225 start_codon:yes stop_codon:yes gene_type:complete